MWPARSRFGMGRPRPRTVWPMTSKTRARRRGGMGAGGHGEAKDEGGTISEVEADDDWFAPLVTAFASCPLSHLPRVAWEGRVEAANRR
ncbi:Os06g0595300 [Oryza sativa Japonica Group]|uniref:Os06g0595300 protein n=1 Tax=Oryza sativa subsp. japonica TaxID=39947 RepID=A0A0P0WYL6_ORYSJ|nr:Os06g0595300 [Oryza sativa Japonica Group]